jgi:8-oxo-dGTP pyrophosphatase MutT (NUDIX family)
MFNPTELLRQSYKKKSFPELDAYVRHSAEEARRLTPSPKESAVIIALFKEEGEYHMTLIKRPEYNGVHSGQMAFPGGKRDDEDMDLSETARREYFEELSYRLDNDTELFALSEIYIPPSKLLVQPFVVELPEPPKYAPDQREVADVVAFPLRELGKNMQVLQHDVYMPHREMKVKVPAIPCGDYLIWGATAIMIYELRDRLKLSDFF